MGETLVHHDLAYKCTEFDKPDEIQDVKFLEKQLQLIFIQKRKPRPLFQLKIPSQIPFKLDMSSTCKYGWISTIYS